MISVIIVDDEVSCSETLSALLKEHCHEVEVVSVCNSAPDALQAVKTYEPQLLFLDVELPDMNAFQLLDKIKLFSFQLILMSYRDENAINAIHYGAVDFLLKPVNIQHLKEAVEKAGQRLESNFQISHVAEVLEKMHEKMMSIEKIALPTIEGLQMVALKAIIYCSSNSNYTNFILKNNQKLHVCRTLKEIESILNGYSFLRVHHSYLVNLNEVKKYIKGEGGALIMTDNTNINVSRSYKETLMRKLQGSKH